MGQQLPAPDSPPSPPYDVLVTGSSGHLGTALMLRLPDLGLRPLGIDILPASCPLVRARAGDTLTGSVSDRDFVREILAANPHIRHIVHAATLHKPHVASHPAQAFIDANLTGTLTLLEAAADILVPGGRFASFIFISTTSTFGAALSPLPGLPAAWIDESVTPKPKNIYGVTKCAAEDLCYLAHKANPSLPVLVLRTSRFFPEEDDDEERRSAMGEDNLKVLELTYRRCDIHDVVSACRSAMDAAKEIGWGKYIISAPPPFRRDDETLTALNAGRSADVLERVAPGVGDVFRARGWKFLPCIDRVYDSSRAVAELGWMPEYTFERTVERVKKGEEWRSPLARQVGRKGYHAVSTGVYTKR